MLILTATADVSLSSGTTETAPVPAVYLGKMKNSTVLFIKIYLENDFRTFRVCDRDCTVYETYFSLSIYLHREIMKWF